MVSGTSLQVTTGVRMLALAYFGTRHFSGQQPFADCAGLQGVAVRVPDIPAYKLTPQACGARVVPTTLDAVYETLQTGAADAQENPIRTFYERKYFEQQKHLMLTGHMVMGMTFQASPKLWAQLSASEQKVFTEVAQEAAARTTAQIEARETELLDLLKKSGLQIHTVNRASLRDAVLQAGAVQAMGYAQPDCERITDLK